MAVEPEFPNGIIRIYHCKLSSGLDKYCEITTPIQLTANRIAQAKFQHEEIVDV